VSLQSIRSAGALMLFGIAASACQDLPSAPESPPASGNVTANRGAADAAEHRIAVRLLSQHAHAGRS